MTRWSWAATLFLVLADPSSLWASEGRGVNALLIDSLGRVQNVPSIELQWKWVDDAPVAQISAKLPNPVAKLLKKSAGIEVRDTSSERLTAYLSNRGATVELELERLPGRYSLLLSLSDESPPQLLTAPSCQDVGIELRPGTPPPTQALRMVGLSCAGDVLTFHSLNDASLGKSDLGEAAGESTRVTRRRLRPPEGGFKIPQGKPDLLLGTAAFQTGPRKDAAGTVQVFLTPRERRLRFSANMGFTFLSYVENPSIVAIDEWLWTWKGGVDFALVPKRWTLSASAFLNLIPLGKSNPGIPTARFYGVNARVGYRLPFRFLPPWLDLDVALGKYFWGTLVSGGAYGIQFLSGYQILVPAMFRSQGVTRATVYAKYSPIAESALGISFNNYELAVGGSYRLSPASTRKFPLSLTLDLSTLAVNTVAGALNTARLKTVSLGVGTAF